MAGALDRRLDRYRWAGYGLAVAGFALWLGLVTRGYPVQAGLWYGVVVAGAGCLLGYAVGFDRGRNHPD